MADEARRGQGMIVPSLFLGLGGVGSRIVDRIAGRAMRLPNWDGKLSVLTSFVSIDTNELDQHKLRFIPPANRLNISSYDKAAAIDGYRRSHNKQVEQWLAPSYQAREGAKPGAGQIRIESRLGFYFHSLRIKDRISQIVKAAKAENTWRQQTPPKYNVYLFCSVAGGTGSGSFLPAAYLVDATLREQNMEPRSIANLVLSTLMTGTVGPELHRDIHANTYAALKELEYLTKLGYPKVTQSGRRSEPFVYVRNDALIDDDRGIPHVTTRPFFLSFLFDQPAHTSLGNYEAAIADAGYLQIFTPIIDNLASEYDNYEKNLTELTNFPGKFKHVGSGYSKNFGAYGAAALVLPANDLLEYCALRFAAHAIRSQITFGIDPTDTNDDRARAVARLAVRYDDPKFLALGRDAQDDAINGAFVASVREMARQDEARELTQGYWFELVESIDEGKVAAHDAQGQPVRAESVLQTVRRQLDQQCQDLINRVAIKDRVFNFPPEAVNSYLDAISRLKEDLQAARRTVDDGLKGVEVSAREGEAIAALKLDPIAERYLVLRLMEECQRSLIPEVEVERKKWADKDPSNAKVQERLEKELYELLQEAASSRTFLRRNRAFDDLREEAQGEYRAAVTAARKSFESQVKLSQRRALYDYLKRRAHQYAGLATRMDGLVRDLEREAERLRAGDDRVEPGYALCVEVFQKLEKPNARIWDKVHGHLFVDKGRYLTTFDRNVLAETIARELKPIVREDGRVEEKQTDQLVRDLRNALVRLGATRLRAEIFGTGDDPGLDLARGLAIEADLVLREQRSADQEIGQGEIDAYIDEKLAAFRRLAGPFARVQSAQAETLDDGVLVNQTRQLVTGVANDRHRHAAEAFQERLHNVLAASGRQVKYDFWIDPRLAIVHDVVLPVPLYYFQPVNGEIENAYLQLASDGRRAYFLHIDYHWEEALPNLNPRHSEVAVGWSLQTLAQGLMTEVITTREREWLWHLDQGRVEVLGNTLATTLYQLSDYRHLRPALRESLERGIAEAKQKLFLADQKARLEKLSAHFGAVLRELELMEVHGSIEPAHVIDRPVVHALLGVIEDQLTAIAREANRESVFDRVKV